MGTTRSHFPAHLARALASQKRAATEVADPYPCWKLNLLNEKPTKLEPSSLFSLFFWPKGRQIVSDLQWQGQVWLGRVPGSHRHCMVP